MEGLAPETRLIDAMLRVEEMLDRLVAHHPATGKFMKVLNQESVARELRLADVARMLDLPVETLLAVAQGAEMPELPQECGENGQPEAGWVEPGDDRAALDLRPVFERGIEPLAMILEEISRLPRGTTFVIDAPFHPLPLRRLLGGRGYDSCARQLSAEHWQVAFRPKLA